MLQKIIGILLAFAGGGVFWAGLSKYPHPVWGLMILGWCLLFAGAAVNGKRSP